MDKRLCEEINSMRDSLKPEQIWKSKAVENYFIDTAKAIIDRYGIDFQIIIHVIYDTSPNATIAQTSFNKIILNAGCIQVKKILKLENQFLYLKGLLAHELSHILYMDKKIYSHYKDTLKKGIFYPKIPEGANEIIDVIKNQKSATKLLQIALDLVNIIEDGYGENTFLANFYGNIIEGMNYMRSEFFKDLNNLDIIEKNFEENPFSSIRSVIMQYSLYHTVKGDQTKDFAVLKELDKCKTLIDNSLSMNSRNRYSITNQLIVIFWDYIKPLITEELDEENEDNNENNEDTKDNNGNNSENSNNDSESNNQGSCENQNSNKELQICIKPPMGEGGNQLVEPDIKASNEPFSINIVNNSNALSEIMSEEVSQIVEQVLIQLAQKSLEEKNKTLMNIEANEGNYSGGHVYVERASEVSLEMINEYSNYKEEIEISRRMQKSIKQKLQDQRKGGKKSNLYLGRKVEARSIIKNDGKCFYNNNLPKNVPRIAIMYILDESGSMDSIASNNIKRIEYAKKTGVILEDFCRSLEFPICIIGSTADYKHEKSSELTIYSSFNSFDKNDKYRLMEIQSKSCNRDGAALRYGLNMLLKRPEEIKILFMMSDGRPNAYNYGGILAEKELKELKNECIKKGVLLFSAAVGSDKEKIESIYENCFLDITDMDTLPKIFTDKIKQFIRR